MSTAPLNPNPLGNLNYEQEVLDPYPGVRAEIDDNPEPDLVEPTPENYVEEVLDEETVVLNSENQPEFLSNL